jgi:hypothetical protein
MSASTGRGFIRAASTVHQAWKVNFTTSVFDKPYGYDAEKFSITWSKKALKSFTIHLTNNECQPLPAGFGLQFNMVIRPPVT